MQNDCLYFKSAGGCSRGDKCKFLHSSSVSSTAAVCSFFSRGLCQRGDACKFSHEHAHPTLSYAQSEQQGLPDLSICAAQSTPVCKFFLSGFCAKGTNCPFVHENQKIEPEFFDYPGYNDTGWDAWAENSATCEQEYACPPVCVFFLRGNCTKPNCPFLHHVEESEITHTGVVEEVQSSPQIEELKSDERNVIGLTRCVFGAGAEVQKVVTNPRSLLFQTQCMTNVAEADIKAILSRFGKLKLFEYKQDRAPKNAQTKSYAKASYDSIEPTLTAIEALKNTPHAIEFVADVLKRSLKSANVSQARFLKVQWFAPPPPMAYVHFHTAPLARKAALTCNENLLSGRQLRAYFQPPTRGQRTSFTAVVKFHGHPPSNEDFASFFSENKVAGFMHATTKVPRVTNVNAAARDLLEEHGGAIESFSMQQTAKHDSKRKALVRFVDTQSAAKAVAALNGHKQPELNGGPMYLTPYFTCKFSVLRDLWAVLGDEILSLQAALEDDTVSRVKFHIFPTERVVALKLSSSDAPELATARVMVENLLKGEVIYGNQKRAAEAGTAGGTGGAAEKAAPLWHESFAGPQGLILVKSFTAGAPSPVFILREENVRQLRCFGKPSAVAFCCEAVIAHIAHCTQIRRSIPIKEPNLLNALLKAGRLEELQKHCGALTRPMVDFMSTSLLVTGDASVEQRAISFVLHLAAELKAAGKANAGSASSKVSAVEGPLCPVCMCPVEDDDCKLLECGHAYCIGCFNQYLAQAHSNYDAKFPICCLSEHCGVPVPLYELEAALDIEQSARMYLAALKCYVKQNPHSCSFCITPDCNQVYTWEGPADLVVQCSTCFVSICTACKVEHHEGLTCAQYEDKRSSGEIAYKAWKAAHNVKACPKCGVDIEKSEGCNHMQCANCKIHICWVCLATFRDGTLTYDHMKKAHGGFYDR